jgi:hypothetical protein
VEAGTARPFRQSAQSAQSAQLGLGDMLRISGLLAGGITLASGVLWFAVLFVVKYLIEALGVESTIFLVQLNDWVAVATKVALLVFLCVLFSRLRKNVTGTSLIRLSIVCAAFFLAADVVLDRLIILSELRPATNASGAIISEDLWKLHVNFGERALFSLVTLSLGSFMLVTSLKLAGFARVLGVVGLVLSIFSFAGMLFRDAASWLNKFGVVSSSELLGPNFAIIDDAINYAHGSFLIVLAAFVLATAWKVNDA